MITIEEAISRGALVDPPGETPYDQIPAEFRLLTPIGRGLFQVVDIRYCQNGAMEHGHMVQCDNVQAQEDLEDHIHG